jgi:hypothetical protein
VDPPQSPASKARAAVQTARGRALLASMGLDALLDASGVSNALRGSGVNGELGSLLMEYRLYHFSLQAARTLCRCSWQAYFTPPIPELEDTLPGAAAPPPAAAAAVAADGKSAGPLPPAPPARAPSKSDAPAPAATSAAAADSKAGAEVKSAAAAQSVTDSASATAALIAAMTPRSAAAAAATLPASAPSADVVGPLPSSAPPLLRPASSGTGHMVQPTLTAGAAHELGIDVGRPSAAQKNPSSADVKIDVRRPGRPSVSSDARPSAARATPAAPVVADSDVKKSEYIDLREAGFRQVYHAHERSTDTVVYVAQKSWKFVIGKDATRALVHRGKPSADDSQLLSLSSPPLPSLPPSSSLHAVGCAQRFGEPFR